MIPLVVKDCQGEPGSAPRTELNGGNETTSWEDTHSSGAFVWVALGTALEKRGNREPGETR